MRGLKVILICLLGTIQLCPAQTRNPDRIVAEAIERSEKALFNADFDKASRSVLPPAYDSLYRIKTDHKVLLTIQYLRVQGMTNIVKMIQPLRQENFDMLNQYLDFVEKRGNRHLKAKFYLAYSSALRSIQRADEALTFEEKSKTLFKKLRVKSKMAEIRASQISRIHNQWLTEGKKNDILTLIPKYKNEIEFSGRHSKYALSYNTRHLAQIHRRQTLDYEESLKWFKKSLELREEIGFKPFIPASISSLGDVYTKMGESDQAIEAYLKSARLADEIGFVRYQYYPRLMIGDIYLEKGNQEKAKEYFEKALKSARDNGYTAGINQASERLNSFD